MITRYSILNVDSCTLRYLSQTNAFDNENSVIRYFHFAYYLTNDLIALGVNLVVDCCLVHHIKSERSKKVAKLQKIFDENEKKKAER